MLYPVNQVCGRPVRTLAHPSNQVCGRPVRTLAHPSNQVCGRPVRTLAHPVKHPDVSGPTSLDRRCRPLSTGDVHRSRRGMSTWTGLARDLVKPDVGAGRRGDAAGPGIGPGRVIRIRR
jgi:hypothetical protein